MARISKTEDGFVYASDFEKVDAHAIRPEEYEDIPELTDEMLARARPGHEILPEIMRRAGRPKSQNPKQLVSIRLDRDVVEGLRATGTGWQSRANQALRDYLGKKAG